MSGNGRRRRDEEEEWLLDPHRSSFDSPFNSSFIIHRSSFKGVFSWLKS